MLLRGLHRRLLALLAGVLLAVTGIAAATPARAQAQEPNLVIFGDSVIADTPPLEHVAVNTSALSSSSSGSSVTPSAGGCATSDSSYAAQTAQQLALLPRDYSCAGATSFTPSDSPVADQIDHALADGALDPTTERVLVTVGFNDTYNNLDLPAGEIRARFVEAMVPQGQVHRSGVSALSIKQAA